jgi:hypothetical protein
MWNMREGQASLIWSWGSWWLLIYYIIATIHIHGTELFEETITALQLCSNLQSFTWTDDHADRMTRQPHTDPIPYDVADQSLRRIIQVLRGLPIRELTIRTYSGLSEEAWTEMKKLTGLTTLALWCQEGQPRVLQGWSESLADTLTHLSLGASWFLSFLFRFFDLSIAAVSRRACYCVA